MSKNFASALVTMTITNFYASTNKWTRRMY